MQLLEKYIEYLTLERNYAQLTANAYRQDIIQFFSFCYEEYHIESPKDVNQNILRSWVVFLNKRGTKIRSINRKLSSLKGFYRFLFEIEHLDTDMLDSFPLIKFQKARSIAFSQDEVRSTLNNIDDSNFTGARDKLMIELLYATGMRRNELSNIQLSDISFESKTLKILGKRNKQRLIPLFDAVISSIKNYIKLREEKSTDHDYLFITETGVRIYDNLIYRSVRKHFQGFTTKQKRSPHILRHSFATHLLQEDADLNSIKELLGHNSLAATENYIKNDLTMLKKTYKNSHPRESKSKD